MGALPTLGGAHTAGNRGLLRVQLVLATSSPSPQPLPGRKAPPPELDPLDVPAVCGGVGGVSGCGNTAVGGGEILVTPRLMLTWCS